MRHSRLGRIAPLLVVMPELDADEIARLDSRDGDRKSGCKSGHLREYLEFRSFGHTISLLSARIIAYGAFRHKRPQVSTGLRQVGPGFDIIRGMRTVERETDEGCEHFAKHAHKGV